MQCIERPRWEDYDYTYMNPKAPFGWMGNGLTLIDVDPTVNKADYLDRSHVDP